MKRKISRTLFLSTVVLCIALTGCGLKSAASVKYREPGEIPQDTTAQNESVETTPAELQKQAREAAEPVENDIQPTETTAGEAAGVPFTFVDVDGISFTAETDPAVPAKNYFWSCFRHDGEKVSYVGDKNYTYRLGVDVSYHQEEIDWKKVKAAGYDFAFIRLGYRGYGDEGSINLDTRYVENMKNAKKAGMDIGVYFFSQAVSDTEAAEEADFVLQNLRGYELQCPVVYDPETIADEGARTTGISGEQLTRNALIFGKKIRAAGYDTMLYCNLYWQAFVLDLGQLTDYKFWYADYEREPQTPYHFDYWQYDYEGSVDGITGYADLNIQLIKK